MIKLINNSFFQTFKERNFVQYLLFILLFMVFGFLVLIPYLKVFNGGFSSVSDDWGNFGDYLSGTLGAFFGFASILVIVQTYRKQMKLNYLQSFENSFFNLLNTQREILKSCREQESNTYKDKIGFEGVSIITIRTISELRFFNLGNQNLIKMVEHIFKKSSFLSFYFKHMYQILKYIDESELNQSEKVKYFDIVQAQINSNELFLCLLHCLTSKAESFSHLAKKYNFFENLEGVEFDGDSLIQRIKDEKHLEGYKLKNFN